MRFGRTAVLHVDDLGLCAGANRAFLELAARGFVTCGSVMVPAPAADAMLEAGAADPALDVGVHLTLTSEWDSPRWGPIIRAGPSSGLVDADGCFPRDMAALRRHLVPEAAEAELRAQIERALRAGLRPTHIDAHMAAAMLPDLLGAHVRLAREYGLVPVLPRRCPFAPDPAAYAAAVAALDAEGVPLPDDIRGTLPVEETALAAGWQRMIDGLAPGVTHFALHCTAPGEIERISPQHAPWRTAEYRLLRSGRVSAWLKEAGIRMQGYREAARPAP